MQTVPLPTQLAGNDVESFATYVAQRGSLPARLLETATTQKLAVTCGLLLLQVIVTCEPRSVAPHGRLFGQLPDGQSAAEKLLFTVFDEPPIFVPGHEGSLPAQPDVLSVQISKWNVPVPFPRPSLPPLVAALPMQSVSWSIVRVAPFWKRCFECAVPPFAGEPVVDAMTRQ